MSVSLYGSGNTVLQVVSSIQTLKISVGTTYASTGLTATITPQSTSSKILIMAQLTGVSADAAGGGGFAIYKNGSSLWAPSPVDSNGPYMLYSTAAVWNTIPLNYVDSPTTTSATTYAIYWRGYANTFYMGGAPSATTSGQHSLILMEISGS